MFCKSAESFEKSMPLYCTGNDLLYIAEGFRDVLFQVIIIPLDPPRLDCRSMPDCCVISLGRLTVCDGRYATEFSMGCLEYGKGRQFLAFQLPREYRNTARTTELVMTFTILVYLSLSLSTLITPHWKMLRS